MILIKSATILDGTGAPSRRGDVLIKKDRISAVGALSNAEASTVIDGLGLYVTPGFIDIQTSCDHYLSLFTNPSLEDFPLQGVTTVIGGHSGSSLAPLLYGSLESIQKWADPNQINVDWHSMREFLNTLSKHKIGVNFGTLVGHATIRRALIGEEVRDLTASELNVFKHLVQESIHEGAFGLSTGLGYVHARNTPQSELIELAKTVQKAGGVYSTHLRDEHEGVVDAVQETLNLIRETNVKTLITTFRPIIGFEKEYQESLTHIEQASGKYDVHFSAYPFDTSIVPIYMLLPKWAQTGGKEEILESLEDPDFSKRVRDELRAVNGNDVRVAHVGNRPHFDYLVGKTLTEFAENQELDTADAFIKLARLTKLRAVVFVRNVDLVVTLESLAQPMSFVTANSAALKSSKHVYKHERFTRTFPRFLEHALHNDAFTLESAVEQITQAPAKKLGLKNRGVIREGAYADVTLFSTNSNKKVSIEHVFVNGEHAVDKGEYTQSRAGKVLMRK